MRTVSVEDIYEGIPSGYDSTDYAYYSASNLGNGLADASSTNYAQINLTRGSDAVTMFYYKFDTSSIPANATIDSVSVRAKCYISQTNANRISTRTVQMCSGTTMKGSAYTVSNSTTAFTMSVGTWTRAELDDMRIRVYGVRGSSNTTTDYYFRFYGAEVTIEYHYDEHWYTVTASSRVSEVTVQPASQELLEGESTVVALNQNTGIIVKDNGNDVTSQLVQRSASGTFSSNPDTVDDITFNENATYPPENALDGTASTNYARFTLTNTQQYASFAFDMSAIPLGTQILSVDCRVKGYVSSTSGNITVKSAQLYSGNTAKGQATTIPTSNSTWNIASVGDWTASEVRNIKLRIDGRASATYYIYIYGADLTVTYSDNGTVYVYTISNINIDHTIQVDPIEENNIPFRIKRNGQ